MILTNIKKHKLHFLLSNVLDLIFMAAFLLTFSIIMQNIFNLLFDLSVLSQHFSTCPKATSRAVQEDADYR